MPLLSPPYLFHVPSISFACSLISWLTFGEKYKPRSFSLCIFLQLLLLPPSQAQYLPQYPIPERLQLTLLPWYKMSSFTLMSNNKEIMNFDVLLTLHLSIFVLVINQLDGQNFGFIIHVSSTCAHHQEVKIAIHNLWYHHTHWWPCRAPDGHL